MLHEFNYTKTAKTWINAKSLLSAYGTSCSNGKTWACLRAGRLLNLYDVSGITDPAGRALLYFDQGCKIGNIEACNRAGKGHSAPARKIKFHEMGCFLPEAENVLGVRDDGLYQQSSCITAAKLLVAHYKKNTDKNEDNSILRRAKKIYKRMCKFQKNTDPNCYLDKIRHIIFKRAIARSKAKKE